ncbi:MAG: spore coat U domain-containing protein [Pseudomonadota bacterium]
MKKFLKNMAMALSLGLVISGSALAATTSTTMNVTANVGAVCTVSATPVDFGLYAGAQKNATGTITVNCTNLAPYNVGIDQGLNYDGSFRYITNGTDDILYELYSDAGYTSIWGDNGVTGGNYPWGNPVAGIGNGANQVLTVYGELSAGPLPSPGSYSDTVTVVVEF